MNNWTCAVQTNGNTVETHINRVQIHINTIQTYGNTVQTDCRPSLQSNETQTNKKI